MASDKGARILELRQNLSKYLRSVTRGESLRVSDWTTRLQRFSGFACLGFMAFLAGPVIVYSYNSSELTWRGGSWSMSALAFVACILLVAWILERRHPRLVSGLRALAHVTAAYLIVRHYLLPIPFGTLDGAERPNINVLSDSSFYSTLVIAASLASLYAFRAGLVKGFVVLGSAFSAVFALYVYANIPPPIASKDITRYSTFSTERNVVVLSFDSLQSDVVRRVLEERADLREALDGFSFFEDTASFAPNTHFSVLSTLTGLYLPTGEDGALLKDLWADFGERSIGSVLHTFGYVSDVYHVPCRMNPGGNCFRNRDILRNTVSKGEGLDALEVSVLRVLPRSISWEVMGHLVSVKALFGGRASGFVEEVRRDQDALQFGLDLLSFRALYESVTLDETPAFKFYHYLWTHQPIRFDDACAYNVASVQTFDGARSETICLLTELGRLLDHLKQIGVYDQSFLVVTSDHGYNYTVQPAYGEDGRPYLGGTRNQNGDGPWSASRYWPALLIKPFGARGEVSYIGSPASLVDIAPTICAATLDSESCRAARFDGVDLFGDVSPDRRRRVMLFEGDRQNLGAVHSDTRLFRTYDFGGPSSRAVPALMDKTIELEPIVAFDFSSREERSRILSVGLSVPEPWGTWTSGEFAQIIFLAGERASGRRLVIKSTAFVSEANPRVTASVHLNDVSLGQMTFSLSEDGPSGRKTFSFSMPDKTLSFAGPNRLSFRIEGAVPPRSLGLSQDNRVLGLGLVEMSFE